MWSTLQSLSQYQMKPRGIFARQNAWWYLMGVAACWIPCNPVLFWKKYGVLLSKVEQEVHHMLQVNNTEGIVWLVMRITMSSINKRGKLAFNYYSNIASFLSNMLVSIGL